MIESAPAPSARREELLDLAYAYVAENGLAELSLRGINLSRIESRPVKDHFGHYRFYLDFDGHVADARIGEAMAALQRRCDSVRFLGSYPKADRKPASVRPGSSEQAFRNAAEWLAAVRAGRLA